MRANPPRGTADNGELVTSHGIAGIEQVFGAGVRVRRAGGRGHRASVAITETAHRRRQYSGPMLNGKRITVVLPAYNAAETLQKTVDELDRAVVDDVLLVDDASADGTIRLAHSGSGCAPSVTTGIAATEPTRRPATKPRSRRVRTSLSCSTPITSTHRCSCRRWPQ